jgi:CheY-like chemotaxis protein
MAKRAPRHTILVCEDDPLVSAFVQDVLKVAGHRVVGARDGESAIEIATQLQPSVVTLDIDMPGLDGGAVIGRLKANPATAHIPVIIVSAHPGWLTFVDRGQAVAVLEKPCPPWELQAAVEQALPHRGRPRSSRGPRSSGPPPRRT